MVRIRMKRMGRRHRPFYRINAIEKREPRDGRVIEELGWFDPIETNPERQISLKIERIKHWMNHGAQPSDAVMDLLCKHEVVDGAEWAAKREARVVKKKAEINAARDVAAAEAKAKAEAEAKAAAEAEAEAKAKAEAEAAAAAAEPAAEGGDDA